MKTHKKKIIYVGFSSVVLMLAFFIMQSLQKSLAMNVMPTSNNFVNNTNITADKENNSNRIDNIITADKENNDNYTNNTRNRNIRMREEDDNNKLSVTPKVKIIKPKKEVVKGKTKLEAKVKEAKNVEFYLTEKGSNIDKYIGSAQKSSDDDWHLDFDSNASPNGSFYLKAKIKNDYGNYESNKKTLNIDNGVASIDKNQINVDNAVKNKDTSKSNKQNNKISNEQRNNQNNKEVNYNDLTNQAWQEKFFHQVICQDKDVCSGKADPDKDGLTNDEEFRYKTDPLNPDSDRDGYLDGDEIKNGFNPLKYSPGDKSDRIVFESPKKKGIVKKNLYKVTSVKLKKENTKKKDLVLSGKGIPNSFVTVYIYSSDPIILTVKTDKDGNWSYTLDKEIENGEHQVYVAVTDNTGKITAKSKPLAFVKTAQAVSVIPDKTYTNIVSPSEESKKNGTAIIIVLTLISFGLAVSIIGLIISKFRKSN